MPTKTYCPLEVRTIRSSEVSLKISSTIYERRVLPLAMKINLIFMTGFLGVGLSLARPSLIQKDALAIGNTVNTTSGPVIGRAGSYADQVSTYLGIPFAKPPLDDLRFAPPQRYKGKTTINGTKFVRHIFNYPITLN
jgi:hypothetical protein